jgi:hypothetical protein
VLVTGHGRVAERTFVDGAERNGALLGSCNIALWAHYWRLHIDTFEKLTNNFNDVISTMLANEICRYFTIEEFLSSKQPRSRFIWLIQTRHLINDVFQIQQCSLGFRLREGLTLIPS